APLRQRPRQRPERGNHHHEQHVLGHVPAGAGFRPVVQRPEDRQHGQQQGQVKADRVAPPRRYPSATEQVERPDQQHQRGGQPQGQALGPVAEQPVRQRRQRQEQQQPERQAHGGRLSS